MLEEALVALGSADSPLRARVQACLAMALYWSDSPERRDAMSREAVAMARRLGDTATLAFTLDCRLKALWGPGGVDERLASASEIVALATAAGSWRGGAGGGWPCASEAPSPPPIARSPR